MATFMVQGHSSSKASADYIELHVCNFTVGSQNPMALEHKHIVEGPSYSKDLQTMNSLVFDLCLISFR